MTRFPRARREEGEVLSVTKLELVPAITFTETLCRKLCRKLRRNGQNFDKDPKTGFWTNSKLECFPLPPGEVRIWFGAGIVPFVCLLGKLKELRVTIAKLHIESILSSDVMPLTPFIVFVPISPTGPVA